MSEFNEPSKSGWAEFHRGCGWFLFVLGGIGFVASLAADSDSRRMPMFQLAIVGIAGGITALLTVPLRHA